MVVFGVEIDMAVTDSLSALELYQYVFDAKNAEATSYEKGLNEAVFSIYGTRFHLIDENPEFQITAPADGDPKPVWFNLVVPDINETFERAMRAGCDAIQPVAEMPEMGVINALFADPFGYLWMLHQIVREVSFEERSRVFEEEIGIEN